MPLQRIYRSVGYGLPEECYYIESHRELMAAEFVLLAYLIGYPEDGINVRPRYRGPVTEIGPRLSVETAFSSNAVAICRSLGVPVRRIEKSVRYPRASGGDQAFDVMTQMAYPHPLDSLRFKQKPEPVRTIPVLENGTLALIRADKALGLGFDAESIEYYARLFEAMGRNPTDVEIFQIANGNSEHSRHHHWNAAQVIDGVEMPESLMDVVKAPWKSRPGRNLVAFHDNAGVIEGNLVKLLTRESLEPLSPFVVREVLQHITMTAETHNHPTFIAPFPGAETGVGGRIRDSRAVGRGAFGHAGFAGYVVGNLFIPGYSIAGEGTFSTRANASPLEILIEGSNGVSDYANKIGEPGIGGITRSFGQMIGERRAWYEFRKPILYSAGVGRIREENLAKREPKRGMRIVRIGGPAYRIGVGGGSASSIMPGANSAELDLKSVQRGNAEMENRVNRVIQACAELGKNNPIQSIHDQGAGGPSNVLTELMDPIGGRVDIRKITVGDKTMSVLELWAAEYQEGYGLLVRPKDLDAFKRLCGRERVPCEAVGKITGSGKVMLEDSRSGATPVNLKLSHILGDLPRKRFADARVSRDLIPFKVPRHLPIAELLTMVFGLPQVGSKGFLTRKIDRSVTGVVVQQQCCGPFQIPVSGVAVTADGFEGVTGAAVAFGEQPIKMLINPAAGARMAVAEMLTNIAGARASGMGSIACRANWMWPVKLPGEGAALYDAAVAMRDIMLELGIAINGGKDSLSMAASVEGKRVPSPGQLIIQGVAPMEDVRKVATPDLKSVGKLVSKISVIDLGRGKCRLGGSSLAQAFGQIGNESPDIDDVDLLRRAWNAVQEMVSRGIISAYHDRSDGGLITTLVEMSLAGNAGFLMHFRDDEADAIAELFNEEAAFVYEVPHEQCWREAEVLKKYGLELAPYSISVTPQRTTVDIRQRSESLFCSDLPTLRRQWEATSFEIEKLQSNPETARQEFKSFGETRPIGYQLPKGFVPKPASSAKRRPKAAILREEGTNGDREMAAACFAAGMDPVDVSMEDILAGAVKDFDQFQVICFCGGFSYADAFGSAKGWAAAIRFNPKVKKMFDRFYRRTDTLSLGVCNGCQLMAQIGWVPGDTLSDRTRPRLLHNASRRFESRWSAVKVLPSPSVHLARLTGAVLGIHVAHGEGRLVIPGKAVMKKVLRDKLVPLAFVGPDGEPTDAYPYNPNGSKDGWTALTSKDGRHLAMMPHPERAFLPWQWHWMPSEWRSFEASPWLQLFISMRDWCLEH